MVLVVRHRLAAHIPLLGECPVPAPYDNQDRAIDENAFEVVRGLKFGVVSATPPHFVRRLFIATSWDILLNDVVKSHRYMLQLNAWLDAHSHVIGAK